MHLLPPEDRDQVVELLVALFLVQVLLQMQEQLTLVVVLVEHMVILETVEMEVQV
jgi:hypothetical protein